MLFSPYPAAGALRELYRAGALVAAFSFAGIACSEPLEPAHTSTPSESTKTPAAQLDELMQQIKSMQEKIDRMVAVSSSSLPDSNSAGARLVATFCTQCHATPQPSLHTAEEWSYVTARMRGHMEDNLANVKEPTEGEMKAIVAYMQQFSH